MHQQMLFPVAYFKQTYLCSRLTITRCAPSTKSKASPFSSFRYKLKKIKNRYTPPPLDHLNINHRSLPLSVIQPKHYYWKKGIFFCSPKKLDDKKKLSRPPRRTREFATKFTFNKQLQPSCCRFPALLHVFSTHALFFFSKFHAQKFKHMIFF